VELKMNEANQIIVNGVAKEITEIVRKFQAGEIKPVQCGSQRLGADYINSKPAC
jgi:hypothetical protein